MEESSSSLKRSRSSSHDSCSDSDTNERKSSDCKRKPSECKEKSKVRRYLDSYIAFGFTYIGSEDKPQPKCVICCETFANASMVPSKLQRHLKTKHSNCVNKDKSYFIRLLAGQKKQVQCLVNATTVSDKAQLASFKVAELVAKQMKPHTIVETLIMPACKLIVKTMLGDDAEKKIQKMPFSNNTVLRRIQMMAADIDDNVCSQLRACKRFSLQIDESTDVSGSAQLLAFVRYSDGKTLLEQFLFCRELIRCRGEDIFNSISSYFTANGISWLWCKAICTDGAPSMTGHLNGFLAMARNENPCLVSTHCFIHREALVTKTLGDELKSVLLQVVKLVNYIKSRPLKSRLFQELCKEMSSEHYTLLLHTEVRWLSRGKVLARVYSLREELLKFCVDEKLEADFIQMLSDAEWCSKLAYLVDIFDCLNKLNSSLQGTDCNVLSSTDKLQAFKRKLSLWQHEIQSTDSISMFPESLKADPGGIVLRDIVSQHLSTLNDQLQHYFPSLDTSKYDWIRNPFNHQLDISQLTLPEKEELIEISADRTLHMKFAEMTVNDFWIMLEGEYATIASKAVDILIPFSTTYLCEKGFSSMTAIKTKYRERLASVEDDLRVCLSSIPPRIDKLSGAMQSQISH